MSLLKTEVIESGYDEVVIVREVSISIEDNEIVAIIGSNGMGKSTFMKTIMGLIPANKGKIFFNGQDITLLDTTKRVEMGLVMVPEGKKLFSLMTVEENLLMGAYKARNQMDKNIKFVLKIFPHLKDRLHQAAATLSGGEQQMLAIARGLMASPKLLILDEPSQGLAPYLVEDVYKTIVKINQERGLTIILVEQDVFKALKTANRAYVIENGYIVMEGESNKLLNDDHLKKTYLGV